MDRSKEGRKELMSSTLTLRGKDYWELYTVYVNNDFSLIKDIRLT
jgi:hypothetical protein